MTPRERILRLLTPEFGGDRKPTVLAGIAGGTDKLKPLMAELEAEGLVRFRHCYGGGKWCLARQRGNADLYVVLGILLAVGALLGGFAWWLSHEKAVAFKAGQAEVQGRWDTAKLEADAIERDRNEAIGKVLIAAESQRKAAEAKANKVTQDLQEAKREARRNGIALGGCPGTGQDPAPDGAAGGVAGAVAGPGIRQGALAPRDPGVRLTWEFVREFDGGWTGLDGQPVSGLAPGSGGAERAGAFAPYRLEDAVDVAGENAARCSRDRRSLDTLIRKVQAAGAAWDATNARRENR